MPNSKRTPKLPYEIIESLPFSTRAIQVMGDIQRWDDLKTCVDLFIARNPYVGKPTADGLRTTHIGENGQPVVPVYQVPCYEVRYRVDRRKRRVVLEEME